MYKCKVQGYTAHPLLCLVSEKYGVNLMLPFVINYQRVNLVSWCDARAGHLPKWYYCF